MAAPGGRRNEPARRTRPKAPDARTGSPASFRSPRRAGTRPAPAVSTPSATTSSDSTCARRDDLAAPCAAASRSSGMPLDEASGRSSASRSAACAGRRARSSRCRSRRSPAHAHARAAARARHDLLEVARHHALGDLELEAAPPASAGLGERRAHRLDAPSRCAELARRQVDRHLRCGRRPAARPARGLAAGACAAPIRRSARSGRSPRPAG